MALGRTEHGQPSPEGRREPGNKPHPLSSFRHQSLASVSIEQARVEAREQGSPGASPGGEGSAHLQGHMDNAQQALFLF